MGDKFLEFSKKFLGALDNNRFGHSLKKWVAIGTFWLLVYVVIKHTSADNLVAVATILSSLILTLMGANIVDKYVNKSDQTPPTQP